MDNQYKIYVYDNEKLVNYTQKLGQTRAADIIKKLNINGQEFMEINNMDAVQWKLTRLERNVLKHCIANIKTRPPFESESSIPKMTFNKYNNEAFKEKLGNVLRAQLPTMYNRDNFSPESPSVHHRDNFSPESPSMHRRDNFSPEVTRKAYNSGDSCGYLDFREIKKPGTSAERREHDITIESISKRKPHPIPRYIKRCKEYFKFKRHIRRKHTISEECLIDSNVSLRVKDNEPTYSRNSKDSFYSCSSSMELVPINSEDYNNSLSSELSSVYIYPPSAPQKRNNITVERIKKYVSVGNRQTVNLDVKEDLYDEVIGPIEDIVAEEFQDSDKEDDLSLGENNRQDKRHDPTTCNCGLGFLKFTCMFSCHSMDSDSK